MAELAPREFALIPVTTREAYSNKHIYQILIDRLIGLEYMLVRACPLFLWVKAHRMSRLAIPKT